MLPPEIFFSQLLSALLIVLVSLTRWVSSAPSTGITIIPPSPQKRDDVMISVNSKHSSKEDKNEVDYLQKEIQRLSNELNSVKYNLEKFQLETNKKLSLLQHKTSKTHHAMKCRTGFTNWHDTVGKSLEYLDNFDIHCRHGEYLKQWRMTWGEKHKKKAIRYVCCQL